MDCPDVYKLMNRYIDGEILPEEEKVLEFHLIRCKACQREFAELKEMNAFLNALEPSHDFTDQVMANVQNEKQNRFKRWLPKSYSGWAGVAAVVILCMLIIPSWFGPSEPEVIISQGQVTQGVSQNGEQELTVVDGTIEISGLKGTLNAINSQIMVQPVRADLHDTWWDQFKYRFKRVYQKVVSWFDRDQE